MDTLTVRVTMSEVVARHQRFVAAVEDAVVAMRSEDRPSRDPTEVSVVELGEVSERAHRPVQPFIAVGDAAVTSAHRAALAGGAAALVDWWPTTSELVDALAAACAGRCVVPAAVSTALASRLDDPPAGLRLAADQLVLLQGVADGRTVEELASERGCSSRHLRRQLHTIWELLGASSRAPGLVKATRWGLIC